MTCGVPQGLVLRQMPWLLFYNDLLRLDMPLRIFVVGYADDVAVLTMERNASLIKDVLNPVFELVIGWFTHKKLELVAKKMEVIILTREWAYSPPVVLIGGLRFTFGRTIRYLSALLHSRWHFGSHVREVAARPSVVSAVVSRLLLNSIGQSAAIRRLLTTVVFVKLLYTTDAGRTLPRGRQGTGMPSVVWSILWS